MALFNIPQLKAVLPILKDCYGFDPTEILSELAESLKPYVDDNKMDEIVCEQREKGKTQNVLLNYAINIDGDVEIYTGDSFEKQTNSINDLCSQHIEEKDMRGTAKFVLCFMAAIFYRNTNEGYSDDKIKRLQDSWNLIHPDLLRLFVALNKPRHKQDSPIRICYKTDSPHIIKNREGWFSNLLNGYIRSILGDITLEEAERELDTYSDDKGRRSKNPYLNYIINGTYNFINHILPSETVTAAQCGFLLEYLKIIGQVKDGDTLAILNTLQAKVNGLRSSGLTPVEKHIKSKRFFPRD